jgi:vacuolar-type H+-ATPase subunit H
LYVQIRLYELSGKSRIERAIELIKALDKELDELDLRVEEKAKALQNKAYELAKRERTKYVLKAEEEAFLIKKRYEKEGEEEAKRIKAEGKKKIEKLGQVLADKEQEIKALIIETLLGET